MSDPGEHTVELNPAAAGILWQCRQMALRQRHRGLVVMAGDSGWSAALLAEFIAGVQQLDGLRVTGAGPGEEHDQVEADATAASAASPLERLPAITPQQAHRYLGRELDLLVYDARGGFDPNALAALVGTLRAGGLLVLQTPPLPEWPDYRDPDYHRWVPWPGDITRVRGRFLQRLVTGVRGLVVSEHTPLLKVLQQQVPARNEIRPSGQVTHRYNDQHNGQYHDQHIHHHVGRDVQHTACPSGAVLATKDQQQAVQAIQAVRRGRAHRPLVLRAGRGRGKSAALGMAAAELMRGGTVRILLTAPRPESVDTVFRHAALALNIDRDPSANRLEIGASELRFIAPDQLVFDPPGCELLLVDEAAALPAPLLEQYLPLFGRVVFATTTVGYEGTGRGFDIRFRATLDRRCPQWRQINLHQPVRFAAGDPLEQWLYRALMLDAEAAEDELVAAAMPGQVLCEQIDRDTLLADEETLTQLFGLLVIAHYQTTPRDLRRLLDSPGLQVWVSRFRGQVVAAALVSEEGGFDAALAESIWLGRRRPRGHLLPQTLSAHFGFREACALHYWRVMRIAVHPAVQGRGLGRQLLTRLLEAARLQGVDAIGSSFAATADVVDFWLGAGYRPVGLGLSRDASSGCHSALVLSALSPAAIELEQLAWRRFSEQWPQLLATRFQRLEPELVLGLLRACAVARLQLEQQDWLDLESYCQGRRPLALCQLSLAKLLQLALSRWPGQVDQVLTHAEQGALAQALLQAQATEALVETLQLQGRKALDAWQRQRLATLRDCVLSALAVERR